MDRGGMALFESVLRRERVSRQEVCRSAFLHDGRFGAYWSISERGRRPETRLVGHLTTRVQNALWIV